MTDAEADTVGVTASVVAAACSVLDSDAVMAGVTVSAALAWRVTVAAVDTLGVTVSDADDVELCVTDAAVDTLGVTVSAALA